MKCIVSNCTNDTNRTSWNEIIKFYTFPSDPFMHALWLQALGITDRKQRDTSVICSLHFREEDFYETKVGLPRLRSGAVPVLEKDSVELNEPAALRVCRICLAMDVKMYDFAEYGLDEIYEQITGILICGLERLPKRACWECAARLVSASHFKSRALTSLELLQNILLQSEKYVIKVGDIKSLDRSGTGLKSSLVRKVLVNSDYDLHIRDIFVNEGRQQLKIDEMDPLNSSDPELKDIESSDAEEDNFVDDEEKMHIEVFKEDQIETDKEESIDEPIEHKEDQIETDKEESIDEPIEQPTETNKKKDGTNKKKITQKNIEANEENEKVKKKRQTKKPVRKRREIPESVEDSALDKAIEEFKRSRTKRSIPDLDPKLFTITSLSFTQQIEEINERQNSEAYIRAPYKCHLCYRGYADENSYKSHAIRHDEKSGAYECFVCKTRLKTRSSQRNHINARHTEQFNCNACTFVTKLRGVAREHQKWHAGAKYTCSRCDCEFDKRSTYMGHIRIKHVSDFVCELCGFTFLSKKGVFVHKMLKHRLVDTHTKLEGPYCEECDVTFISVEAHRRHLLLSSKHSTDHNPNRIRNSFQSTYKIPKRGLERFKDRQEDQPIGSKGPICCEECGVELKNKRAYSQHYRRAHPDKYRTSGAPQLAPYMCEQCGKTFRAMMYLEAHMWVHTGVKLYKCDICLKTMTQKANLVSHMATHKSKDGTDKRPTHQCPLCGKHFSNLNNRKRHMFLHTGLKPFKCETCGKRSTTMGEHKTHFEHVHQKKPWPKRVRPKRTKKREISSVED